MKSNEIRALVRGRAFRPQGPNVGREARNASLGGTQLGGLLFRLSDLR
jgi:hypothetical protein